MSNQLPEELEKQILIKIPDFIYYTGRVTVRYKQPDGNWYESEFYPGQFDEELSQAHQSGIEQGRSERVEKLTEIVLQLDKNARKFKAPTQVKNVNSWMTGKFAAINYLTNQFLEALSSK